MKLNLEDVKLNPDQETFLELNCYKESSFKGVNHKLKMSRSTALTFNNRFASLRVNTFGSKTLQTIPLKAITGILLQYRRETRFLVAFGFFLTVAIALLITSFFLNSSSLGFQIMSVVSLVLSLTCGLIFYLSKTIVLEIQNGCSEYAIKIAFKATAKITRDKLEEIISLIQTKIQENT